MSIYDFTEERDGSKGPFHRKSVEIIPGDWSDWTSSPTEILPSASFPFLLQEGNLGLPQAVLHRLYLASVAFPRVKSTSQLDDQEIDRILKQTTSLRRLESSELHASVCLSKGCENQTYLLSARIPPLDIPLQLRTVLPANLLVQHPPPQFFYVDSYL